MRSCNSLNIEKMYGTEIFYEDAANIIIPDAYDEEVSASDIQTVASLSYLRSFYKLP